jgi:hypothetical protein
MLRRLVCFTLLVLLSPALAAAQRCDLHCALSLLGSAGAGAPAASAEAAAGHGDALTTAVARDDAAHQVAATQAAQHQTAQHQAAEHRVLSSPALQGCALAHLPALPPIAIPIPSDGPTLNIDAAPNGFRSIERAPPKPRPKRA